MIECWMTSTRDRLIKAMRQALASGGYHGANLTALLVAANAPKGVLYHHFPGGKRDLAAAAIDQEVNLLRIALQSDKPSSAVFLKKLSHWLTSAYSRLEVTEFQLGCPMAGASHNITVEDESLRNQLAQAFEVIQSTLATELMACGMPKLEAQQWAQMMFATYEGALMVARTTRSGSAITATSDLLLAQLRAQLLTYSQPQTT